MSKGNVTHFLLGPTVETSSPTCSAAGILHGMAHYLTKPCLAAGNHTSYWCSSGFPLLVLGWEGGEG